MRPADNSDDTLEVYADYLIDCGRQEESDWVRESIQGRRPVAWSYEYVGGGGGVGVVGVVGVVVGVVVG